MEELEAAQEEMLGRKINKLNLKRFTDKERHAYNNLMSDQMRDVIESMWKSFHLAGLTPVDEPGKARCVRELFKYAGAQEDFFFFFFFNIFFKKEASPSFCGWPRKAKSGSDSTTKI